jgi:hypothetical protein
MKTHLPFHLVPHQIHDLGIKKIYIIRNPKDVVCSYYSYMSDEYPVYGDVANATWSEYLEMFMQGYCLYGSWFDHVASWWRQRNDPNLLIVTYNDMKKDANQLVAKIAKFVGKPLSEDTVGSIVNNTTFSTMKAQCMNLNNSAFEYEKDLLSTFFRKGEIDDWKNQFTVEQNERFDQMLQEKIADKELLDLLQFE